MKKIFSTLFFVFLLINLKEINYRRKKEGKPKFKIPMIDKHGNRFNLY